MKPTSHEDPKAALKQLQHLARPIKGLATVLWLVSVLSAVSLWLLYLVLAQWAGAWLTASNTPELFSPEHLWPVILTFLLFAAMRALQVILRSKTGEKLHQSLSQQVFQQLHDKRWAMLRHKPLTAWQDIFARHIPAIEHFVIDYKQQMRLVATLPILVLCFVLPYSWLVALILFVTLPTIPLFMIVVGMGTAAVRKKHLKVLDRLGGRFVDRLLGAQTIKLLNQQHSELHNLHQASLLHNKRLAEVLRLAFLNTSVLDFFSTVAVALVAVFIGFALLGEVNIGFYGVTPTLGEGLFMLLLAPAFFAELKNLGRLYHVRAEAVAAADHCLSVFSSVLLQHEGTSHPAFDSVKLSQFTVNGFDQQPLVSGKQLTLKRGEQILLTGASGSGKSVLLEALSGLRPVEGTLAINGQPSTSLRPLLDQVLFLQQQPVLFPGTVSYNVGLGEHPESAISAALEQVGLGDWLGSLPAGLATEMGDLPMLSGGQRQRLALARVILFDTQVVLLDEPTAHLSSGEHESLTECIQQVLKNRTSIWISHKSVPEQAFSQKWIMDEDGLVVSHAL